MTRVACIDIGTVTARLAVADVAAGRVVRLIKHSQICNLGEGVDQTGRLSQGAMERVHACVRGYVALAREARAPAVCCTLTSAARDASNARELGGALASLGLEPVVIPGEVEGALTFLGVTQDLPGQRALVADNGGGSTELAFGELRDGALDLRFVRSVDVGCRRVTERFLQGADPPAPEALARAHEFVAGELAPVVAKGGLRAAGSEGASVAAPEVLAVCGGTVTSLVAIELGLEPYDSSRVHLAELTLAQVEALEARLAALPLAEREKLPGLQAKRAPVMVGGAVIVSELLRQTGFDRLRASESDLLFGLAISAAATLEGRETPTGWKPALAPLSPPEGTAGSYA